eukprot:c5689_g1_i1.p1 GENE.c5689_g1_i1~~c5689_g1_i1.p1  ORF type:complete len:460 (+),score=18.71 c5689_g1_i1:38-1381(+)
MDDRPKGRRSKSQTRAHGESHPQAPDHRRRVPHSGHDSQQVQAPEPQKLYNGHVNKLTPYYSQVILGQLAESAKASAPNSSQAPKPKLYTENPMVEAHKNRTLVSRVLSKVTSKTKKTEEPEESVQPAIIQTEPTQRPQYPPNSVPQHAQQQAPQHAQHQVPQHAQQQVPQHAQHQVPQHAQQQVPQHAQHQVPQQPHTRRSSRPKEVPVHESVPHPKRAHSKPPPASSGHPMPASAAALAPAPVIAPTHAHASAVPAPNGVQQHGRQHSPSRRRRRHRKPKPQDPKSQTEDKHRADSKRSQVVDEHKAEVLLNYVVPKMDTVLPPRTAPQKSVARSQPRVEKEPSQSRIEKEPEATLNWVMDQPIFDNPRIVDAQGKPLSGPEWATWKSAGHNFIGDIFTHGGLKEYSEIMASFPNRSVALHQLDVISAAIPKAWREAMWSKPPKK